jgi:peptidylamidoglycolate lyase
MKRAALALALLAPALLAGEPAPTYRLEPGWPVYPAGIGRGDGSGIAINRHGEVLALDRGDRVWGPGEPPTSPIAVPVLKVFDARTGRLVRQWGAGLFALPHGISVDRHDNMWITDVALHQVFEFSRDGKLLLTLGERGVPGNDARHFNRPTDVLVLPDGSFYVADGYRNTRVVKFTAAGKIAFQWGVPGSGRGEFNLPHSLALGPDGSIYVCDRNNARVQKFDRDGQYLSEFRLPELGRPFAIASLPDGTFAVAGNGGGAGQPDTAGVVIIDREGRVRSRFGSFGTGPGQFSAVHDIAAGPDGALYVADVKGPHFQKFVPGGIVGR